MELPAINLKAIVVVHWLLTVWGCMTVLPLSFSWSNFSIFALGVWTIAQRDSVDAVLMFLIGMLLTILTDIIHLAIFYPSDVVQSDLIRFSLGMAILNLLLKPVSCFFVFQMYRERGGEYNVNFGFPTVSRDRDTYQSIDQQDSSSTSGNPFDHPQDSKPGVRSY
ncbi:type-1 angiotensin II receptor-associated protein [Pholidichthys leucotaenia]